MDERFGASRALKALRFCHEFFIPFRIPTVHFDHRHLLYVTSKQEPHWLGEGILRGFEEPAEAV